MILFHLVMRISCSIEKKIQMKLKAIVVDDEDLARKNLTMLLHDYCQDIEVIGDAGNINSAKEIIEEKKPDVVFLDIRMPSGSEGFVFSRPVHANLPATFALGLDDLEVFGSRIVLSVMHFAT